MSDSSRISRDIYVPQLENGTFHYTLMEIIVASEFHSGWLVKDVPVQSFPTLTEANAVNFTATHGLLPQSSEKSRLKVPQDGSSWVAVGGRFNLE